jgi:hypothetical protein
MLRTPNFLLALALCAFAVSIVAAEPAARAQKSKPAPPLQGKLVQLARGPALSVKGKDIPLSTVRTWHLNSLKDKRLAGHEIRVEGDWAADGTFRVSQFYTVKGGKLYRVRYFCEVCNIESLEPGNCVCCQAPTELQEIPLN